MATTPHELTIRIINANGNGKSRGSGKAAESTTSGGKAVSTAQDAIDASIVARELSAIARQATSLVVSSVSITTGNTASQERIEFGMNAAGKLAAYGTALITGNIPAVAIMAINDTVNIVMKASQIALNEKVEQESLVLSRDRAGIAFNRSRMGGAK